MKKIFTCASLLMGIVMSQSCSKQSSKEMLISPVTNTSTINASVKSNEIYQLTLDKLQNAVITRQASHFELSQVEMDSKTGLLLYKYQPARGYIGPDEVLLSTSKTVVSASAGICNNRGNMYTTTVVTSNISLKINVTDN